MDAATLILPLDGGGVAAGDGEGVKHLALRRFRRPPHLAFQATFPIEGKDYAAADRFSFSKAFL